MRIEHKALRAGQPIRPVVRKFAARLHEARAWIGDQSRDDRPQPICRRPEIGVENGDEGGIRLSEASCQGAGFIAAPRRPVKMRNIVALVAQFADDGTGNRGRPVGAVIEKLNMQFRAGPL